MYKNIVVPVDTFEKSSWKGLVPTIKEYFLDKKDTCVHFVSVCPEDKALSIYSQFIPAGFDKHVEKDIQGKLNKISEEFSGYNAQIKTKVLRGVVYVELLNYVESVCGDLVLLSSHRPELKDYLIGPVASRVLRHSNCSVLVCR